MDRLSIKELASGFLSGRGLTGAVGITAALYAVHLLLLFGFNLVLARVLGAAELGVYAHALAIVNTLSVFTRLGLATLLMRETARLSAERDWERLRGLWGWVAGLSLGLSAGVILIASAVLWAVGDTVSEGRRDTIAAGLAMIAFIGLATLVGSALRGLQRVAAGLSPELVLRPMFQIGAVLAAVWVLGAGGLDAPSAMWLNTGATALYFAVALGLLWRLAPGEARGSGPVRRDVPRWLSAAIPMGLTSGLFQIYDQLAMLVLGAIAMNEETGVFRVVLQVAMIGRFASAPFFMVVAPMFSKLHAEGDRRRMQRVARLAAIGSATAEALFLIGVVLFGEWFLGAAFGAEFRAGYEALVVIALGIALAGLAGPANDLLVMSGHERVAMWAVAGALAINAALCLALVPVLGGLGAAIGIVVSLVAQRGTLAVMAWRRLGIDPTPFGRP